MPDSVERLVASPTAALPSGNPLDLLTPRQRLVFLGRATRVPMATLARLLGITRETVYQDLRSARAALHTPVLTRSTIRLRDHALPSPSGAARRL